MIPEAKILEELKSAQARLFQQWHSSNEVWTEIQRMADLCKFLLPRRKQLQALARRCEKNPLRFCERALGVDWFYVPVGTSARQLKELLKISTGASLLPTSPQELSRLDGNVLLKQLQILAMRRPGRKPLGIYSQALLLRQSSPPVDFHRICLKLNPAYANMTPAQRRAERERIRSGVMRLEFKNRARAQGLRNSPR